jgi:hypothetical protein
MATPASPHFAALCRDVGERTQLGTLFYFNPQQRYGLIRAETWPHAEGVDSPQVYHFRVCDTRMGLPWHRLPLLPQEVEFHLNLRKVPSMGQNPSAIGVSGLPTWGLREGQLRLASDETRSGRTATSIKSGGGIKKHAASKRTIARNVRIGVERSINNTKARADTIRKEAAHRVAADQAELAALEEERIELEAIREALAAARTAECAAEEAAVYRRLEEEAAAEEATAAQASMAAAIASMSDDIASLSLSAGKKTIG